MRKNGKRIGGSHIDGIVGKLMAKPTNKIELQFTEDEHRLIQAGAWLFGNGDVVAYAMEGIRLKLGMDYDDIAKHTKAMMGEIEQ